MFSSGSGAAAWDIRRLRLCILLAWLFFAVGRVAAELTVATDFESGSARVLGIDRERQVVTITPAGDEKRGMPNWWQVRIDGIDPAQPLALEVVARDAKTPDDLRTRWRPLNPAWTLPICAAISTDGKEWRQTEPSDRNGNRAVYRVPAPAKTLWLAWGPPFAPRDATAFVETLAKEHAFARPFPLATSREGRVVMGIVVRDGEKPAKERPAIFITARQHAWECGGSWVAVGLAEWLVSSDEQAAWLRKNAEVFVVPLMDVDHVATGDGGKHALPEDHNRDWSDSPHWPEVAATQKLILALAKEERLALFFDSHNPSSGARLQTFYVQYPPYVGERAAAATEQFLTKARAVFGQIRLLDGKPSVPEHLPVWKAIAAPWVGEHGNPDTVSLTVETPWNIPQGTPAGYREVGRKLGLASAHYLRERRQ